MKNIYYQIITGITIAILGFPFSVLSNSRGTVAQSSSFLIRGFANKCLDADSNADGANGTRIQLWTCTNGGNQRWKAYNDGTIRTVAFPGMCLDADSNADGADGTRVQLWQCNNGSNQKWKFDGRFIRGFANKCLDADSNADGADGTRIQLWTCNNGSNQRWQRI
jgi:hypothetical protein